MCPYPYNGVMMNVTYAAAFKQMVIFLCFLFPEQANVYLLVSLQIVLF